MEVILGELEGSPTPSTLGDLDTSQGASVPKTGSAQVKWTPWMNEVLLMTLLHQCHLGKRADSGFKKEVWTAVTVAVTEVCLGTVTVTDKQVKSKADWWKLMWKEWLQLSNQSGFGYDSVTDLFTASNETWKEYLRVSYFTYFLKDLLTLKIVPQVCNLAPKPSSTSPRPFRRYIRILLSYW
jgi:hypothetical protein